MTASGIVTIYGTGSMQSYGGNWHTSPWYENLSVTKVIIEEGVTSISSYAFQGCNNLKTAIIPSSLKTIGYQAFCFCYNLENILIPEGVTRIDEGAFANCFELTEIYLPSTLTYLNNRAFSCNRKLTDINISAENSKYSSYEGVVYNKSMDTLICCPAGKSSHIIPNGVITIGDYAFDQNSNLISVQFPDSLISIGEGAFTFCRKLTSVIIPANVTTIKSSAFYVASNLEEIVLPKSITSIGWNAFCSTKLTDVYYTGQVDEWDKISIGTENAPLTSAKRHYNVQVVNQDIFELMSEDICLKALPMMDETYGRAFMGFIYNYNKYKEEDYSENKYYHIIRGDYSSFESAEHLEDYILDLSGFVRGSMAQQITDSSSLKEKYSKLLIDHLESKIGKTADYQIISQYTKKAKGYLEEGILDLLTSQVAQRADIIVTDKILKDVGDMISIYDSITSSPQQAMKYVDDMMAIINGATLALQYEFCGRAEYFCSYLSLRDLFSKDSLEFQTAMNGNFAIVQDNNAGSRLINILTALTGKESFLDHRSTLDYWAEFLYQLEHTPVTHDFQITTIKEATCQKTGFVLKTCSHCGKEIIEVIPTTGHKLDFIEGLDPTCYEDGYLPYWKCNMCGKEFLDNQADVPMPSLIKTPAHGHDWGEWYISLAPTATEAGTKIRVCKYDSSHVDSESIPALGYFVQYNSNGGSGLMENLQIQSGEIITLRENGFIPPDGMKFKSWSINSINYMPGDKYIITGDTSIIAVWEDIPVYTAIWLNGDGTELDRKSYVDNQIVPTTDLVPYKSSESAFSYIFNGWDNGTNVNGIITYTPLWTIRKGDLDLQLSIDGWTYGAPANSPSLTGNVGDGTVLYYYKQDGSNLFVEAKPIYPGVHTVKAVIAETDYYNGSEITQTFKIEKALLNVIANNNTISYGDGPENNGVIISGFVNGETESVLTGTLSYDYSYSQYGNTGSYTITPKGLASDNYQITYSPGTLNVEQKEVGLNWSSAPLTFNGTAQAPTATATGLVNSDSCTVSVTGGMTDAGTGYTATASGLSNSNYKLPASVSMAYNIGKALAETLDNVALSMTYTADTVTASVAGKMPANAGMLTYTTGNAQKIGDVSVSGFSVDDSGNVSATLANGASGDTVTLPVTIHSTNYEDSTIHVVVTLTDKVDAGVSITEGNALTRTFGDNAITLHSTLANAGANGSWTWASSNRSVATVSDEGVVTIVGKGETVIT